LLANKHFDCYLSCVTDMTSYIPIVYYPLPTNEKKKRMSDPISKIISALKTDSVIPDVIPASYDFKPSILISIAWPAKGLERVILGDKLPREKTIEEPEIKLLPLVSTPTGFVDDLNSSGGPVAEEAANTYTLVMTDPDAPSREDPKYGQWRHWLVTGVQLPAGTESVSALKSKVAETPYYPPAPPPGSGYHRYVFLLFQEPSGGINLSADAVERKGDFEARPKWNALTFAENYGLKLVGINYFMTQVSK